MAKQKLPKGDFMQRAKAIVDIATGEQPESKPTKKKTVTKTKKK